MKDRNVTLTTISVLVTIMFTILFVVSMVTANVWAANIEESTADTVTVSGSYTVYVSPDKAELHMAVNTKDSTAAKAQEQNTKTVDAVIKRLEELDVKEKSIVTSGYNIYQEYDYEDNKPVGYTVSTSLAVKDLEIDQAGTILTEAVAAGVNEVQYISYTCSNYDEKYENALTDAVAAAKKKAEILAKAADRDLGGVQSIAEGYQNTSARYVNKYPAVEEAAMDDAGAAVGLNPGDSEIMANVTVVYYLK